MPKGRIQLRLSPTALDNLAERAKAAGFTRQAYIEDWLTGGQARGLAGSQADDSNSLSPEATQKRAEKKAARTTRKAKLQKSVKEALPPLPPGGRELPEGRTASIG